MTAVNHSNTKMMIIGLDGASFNLINSWVQEGKLPTIARLIRQGTYGNLRSTIPPLSPVAWSSFMTGKNPGKHGIFGFVMGRSNSYSTELISSKKIIGDRFWDIAGRAGKCVGVLNVPMTYPPDEVNGFMVSGMFAPNLNNFTYPKDLASRMLTHIGDYILNVERGQDYDEKEDFVKRVEYAVQKRKDAILYLMQEYEWDLFIAVFVAPDRLQHLFWADMDPSHPLHNPESGEQFGRVIQNCYIQIDEAIAEILTKVDTDTQVVLLSDHGFTGYSRMVYLNLWLESLGMLRFRDKGNGRQLTPGRLWRVGYRRLLESEFGRLLQRTGWLRRLRYAKQSLPLVREISPTRSSIDWSVTRAFYSSGGGIRLNLKGREPQGIVEPGEEYEALRDFLIKALLDLEDPETGGPVIDMAWKSEDLYAGPFIGSAPDILVEPHHGNGDYARSYSLGERLPSRNLQSFCDTADRITGNHVLDGILVATGKGIKAGHKVSGAEIIDLAPTILYMLGLPVPLDMDGKVLLDVFKDDFVDRNPLKSATPEFQRVEQEVEEIFSEEEDEIIRQRLQNLGYL